MDNGANSHWRLLRISSIFFVLCPAPKSDKEWRGGGAMHWNSFFWLKCHMHMPKKVVLNTKNHLTEWDCKIKLLRKRSPNFPRKKTHLTFHRLDHHPPQRRLEAIHCCLGWGGIPKTWRGILGGVHSPSKSMYMPKGEHGPTKTQPSYMLEIELKVIFWRTFQLKHPFKSKWKHVFLKDQMQHVWLPSHAAIQKSNLWWYNPKRCYWKKAPKQRFQLTFPNLRLSKS